MSFFENFDPTIQPDYSTREERNIFLADFIRDHLKAGEAQILNVGSGGQRFLASHLTEAQLYDVDIQGDADLLVNLEELERFDFADSHFQVSCALDLLEHIENFHAILEEMIRVTEKQIVISLPNPQQTFLEMLRGKTQEADGKDNGETGVYSKFYGLPLAKPTDRHKWHYSIDDVRRLFEHMKDKHSLSKITYFSGHKTNLKKSLVKAAVPNRIYYNLFLPYIWIVLEK